MADSDNNTTLPPVTRRGLLAGTAAAEGQPRLTLESKQTGPSNQRI